MCARRPPGRLAGLGASAGNGVVRRARRARCRGQAVSPEARAWHDPARRRVDQRPGRRRPEVTPAQVQALARDALAGYTAAPRLLERPRIMAITPVGETRPAVTSATGRAPNSKSPCTKRSALERSPPCPDQDRGGGERHWAANGSPGTYEGTGAPGCLGSALTGGNDPRSGTSVARPGEGLGKRWF